MSGYFSPHPHQPGGRAFPHVLFSVAFGLSLLATVFSGWQLWRQHGHVEAMSARHVAIAQAVGRILLYDETLTMSARLAAASGDFSYEKRYDEHDHLLNREFEALKALLPRGDMEQFAGQTDAANLALVKMERRAFELVHRGERREAMELLAGGDYARLKERFSEGMRKTIETADALILRDEKESQRMSLVFVAASAFSLLGFLLVWLFAVRSGKFWIEERKRADETSAQLAAIVQSSSDAIIAMDPDAVITSWNPGAEKVYGYCAAEVLGRSASVLAPEDRIEETRGLIRVALRGEPVDNVETQRVRKDGTLIDVSLSLSQIKDAEGRNLGVSSIVRDITEKKQAERALQKVNRALKALSKCNEALIHAPDEKQLLNEICRIIVDNEGYRLAWVGYVEHDERKTVTPVAHSGYEPGYMERADISWADDERGRGPLGVAIRTGQMQVVQDVKTDPRFARWRDNATRLGYGSVLVAPLLAEARVIGALSIHADEAEAFDDAEINLLRELAANMAFGITTLRTRSAHERSAVRLQRSMENTIQVIAGTVEMRDPYTAGHQHRVTELATAIARDMGLAEDRVHGIRLAGVVHDLGKIHTPAEILNKPGKLNDVEFELIKTHCEAGYEILKDVDFPWPIAQIVYQHQERLDGSGYPRGLKGEEILLEARILMVADVVEAMASHRPYRPALGLEAALHELKSQAGRRYDAVVARVCLGLFEQKGFAFSA